MQSRHFWLILTITVVGVLSPIARASSSTAPVKTPVLTVTPILPSFRSQGAVLPGKPAQGFFDRYRNVKENPNNETNPKFDIRPLGWGGAGAQDQIRYKGGNKAMIRNGYVPVVPKQTSDVSQTKVTPELRGPENTVDCGIRCAHDKANENISFMAKMNLTKVDMIQTLYNDGQYSEVARELGEFCAVEEDNATMDPVTGQAKVDRDYAKDCLERYKRVEGLNAHYAAEGLARNNTMIDRLNTDVSPVAGEGGMQTRSVHFDQTEANSGLTPQSTYLMTVAQLDGEVNNRLNGGAASGNYGFGSLTHKDLENWARVEIGGGSAETDRHLGNLFDKKIQDNQESIVVSQVPTVTEPVGGMPLAQTDRAHIRAKRGDLGGDALRMEKAFAKRFNALKPNFVFQRPSSYDYLAFKKTRGLFLSAIERKQIGVKPQSRQSLDPTQKKSRSAIVRIPAFASSAQMKTERSLVDTPAQRKVDRDLNRQADQSNPKYTVTLDPSELRKEAEAILR